MSESKSVRLVKFYDDTLQVVGETQEEAQVVLRPACEALGLDLQTQLEKLKALQWATIGLIPTVGADGKQREMACLPLEQVPMWLATLHPSKCDPAFREKIVRYQRECVKVLAAHFLGGRSVSAAEIRAEMVSQLAPLVAVSQSMDTTAKAMLRMIERQEHRFESGNGIGPGCAQQINLGLRELAKAKTRHDPRLYRSQLGVETTNLRAMFGFSGTGRQWKRLPLGDWPRMVARLEEMHREALRLDPTASVRPVQPTQLELIRPVPAT